MELTLLEAILHYSLYEVAAIFFVVYSIKLIKKSIKSQLKQARFFPDNNK